MVTPRLTPSYGSFRAWPALNRYTSAVTAPPTTQDIAVLAMKLCFSCSSISLAFLLAVDRSHESGRDAQKASRVLRENGATLAKSALRCPMCALVMEALFPRARHRDDPSTHGVDALSADAIMVHPKVDPRSLSFPGPPRDGAYLTGFVVTGRLEDSKELLSGKIRLYTIIPL